MDAVADSLDRARPHALRRALRLVDGDRPAAEDLVEDVVARLWERARCGDGEPYEVAYVVQSVTNAARNVWRRRRVHDRRVPLLATPSSSPAGDEPAIARIDLDRLLAGLADHDRRLLELRYLDGLSQGEVARRLGVPQGTVASASARALGRLREAVAA